MAAVDYFMKITEIPGESTAPGHKNEIDIFSFSWGESEAGRPGERAGLSRSAGGEQVQVQDFSLVHRLDKASPLLMLACAEGKHFPEALLTVRKGGDAPADYQKYRFTDVLITSITHTGEPTALPTESFTINFVKIEVEYRPILRTGQLGSPVTGFVVNPGRPPL